MTEAQRAGSPMDPDDSDGNLVIDLDESGPPSTPQKRPPPPSASGGSRRKRNRHSSAVLADPEQPSTSTGLGEKSGPDIQQEGISSEKVETSDAGTNVRSISTVTEGGLFGVCEPGTQVSLEGCIFHEDPEGFLVVNVTWRGKSYVGTLVDCSRQEWGPPRPEDLNGIENDRKGPKGRGGKRTGREMLGGRGSLGRQGTPIPRLKSRPSFPSSPQISVDEDTEETGDTEAKIGPAEPLSPVLTECPCNGCKKKFVSEVALKYHQGARHRAESDSQKDPDTRLDPIPLAPDPADPEEPDLTPVENESLQKLFASIKNESPTDSGLEGQGSNPAEAPDLELKERPSSRSPAYSDISDEGAPVLTSESGLENGKSTSRHEIRPPRTEPVPTNESTNSAIMKPNQQETPMKIPRTDQSSRGSETSGIVKSESSSRSRDSSKRKPEAGPSPQMPPHPYAFLRPPIMNLNQGLIDASPTSSSSGKRDMERKEGGMGSPFHFQLGPPSSYPSPQPHPFQLLPPPFSTSPGPNFNFRPISRPSLHHSSPLLQPK